MASRKRPGPARKAAAPRSKQGEVDSGEAVLEILGRMEENRLEALDVAETLGGRAALAIPALQDMQAQIEVAADACCGE